MEKMLIHNQFEDLDGLIKLLLVTAIAMVPFYLHKPAGYGVFLVYLLLVTLVSRIRSRTLLLSGASYSIIVLIPYLFGILVNGLLYFFTKNEAFMWQGSQEVFLRLFRLFIIWYVSILYFHTTRIETILGLLDKLLLPLKLIRLPVQDYLKIIMLVVMDLKGTGEEIRTRFVDQARSAGGGNKSNLRRKINAISQTIVRALVDSFQKIDKVEAQLANSRAEAIFNYRLRLGKPETFVVISMVLLIAILSWIERGAALI